MVELVAPAGNWEMLYAAIDGGADAVYLGIKGFNMRAAARNFSLGELKKAVDVCRRRGVKAYLALNTIIYDNELKKAKNILKKAKECNVDGVICWDFFVIKEAKRLKIKVHISTQASVSNFEALKYYYRLGARRFVLARELSLKQIRKIKEQLTKNKLNAEIECFVHGAMCVSISGRCFISQFLFNKSANRGECIQPCRREYVVTDEENKKLKLGNNYVMSPKDLCALPILDRLVDAGIDSFKIEGRNRSPEYVKTVVSVYRRAIGLINSGSNNFNETIKKELLNKLKEVYNKGFSYGFYLGEPIDGWAGSYGSRATTKKTYVGRVLNFYKRINVAEIKVEARGLKKGDNILATGNKTGAVYDNVISVQIENKDVKSAKKGSRAGIKVNNTLRKNDKLFVVERVKR